MGKSFRNSVQQSAGQKSSPQPALSERKVALAELAQQFDVHVNQITQWRSQLLDGAAGVFGPGKAEASAPSVDLKTLHAKIGELALENDFLEGALIKSGMLSAKR